MSVGGANVNETKRYKYNARVRMYVRICVCMGAISRGKLPVEPSPLSPADFQLSTGRTAEAPLPSTDPLSRARHWRWGNVVLELFASSSTEGPPPPLGKSRASPTVSRREIEQPAEPDCEISAAAASRDMVCQYRRCRRLYDVETTTRFNDTPMTRPRSTLLSGNTRTRRISIRTTITTSPRDNETTKIMTYNNEFSF